MKPWLAYSLIRIGIFAAVFTVLLLVGVEWWLAAILAAVIGVCVAYIFFRNLRDAMALEIAERRSRVPSDVDSIAEDNEN